MTRGRPPKSRAKPAPKSVEIIPPEIEPDDEEPQPQIVEVRHKTEWSEMRPVDEAPAEELIEEEPAKPRRRSEAEELRKKLSKAGITPGSQLKLTIEKYLHSEVVDGQGGMFAEKEHCTKYVCGEDHVKNEDYLDVARRFGPGLYRFTLRMKNMIVTAWDKRISGAGAPPVIGHTNPADPTSPVILQMPDGAHAQQPVAVIDPLDQMVKTATAYQKLKKAFEPEGAPPAAVPPPVTDPKIAALQLIAENPDVMERIGTGIAKTVLGSKNIDNDPWADVAMEAIKSGQAVEIVRAAIDSIFSGLNGLFPKGGQNGQARHAPPPPPQSGVAPVAAPMQHQPAAGVPLNSTVQPVHTRGNGEGTPGAQAPGMTTEDQALALVIEHCRRNIPVKVCFNRLVNLADAIEEQAPAGSIYDYLEMFGKMPTEAALTFVNGLPGGREVTGLAHCKEWTAELQKMIRDSQSQDTPEAPQ